MNRFLTTFLVLASFIRPAPAGEFPPPKSLGNAAGYGRNIQRTMRLLAESTPEKRNTVRVLFYGQSITEQGWWNIVADDLRTRFPNANLVIENRALAGFASQMLVRTAETDLYLFQPDLLIFHVYGAHDKYEDIIRRTRERTCAEILIQTDHVTKSADLTEETDPAKVPISSEKPLLIEDWTLDVKRANPSNEKEFAFTLTGSKTGADGEGRSDQRFVSKSGRIVITPEDWNASYAIGLAGIKPVPEHFRVMWDVTPLFVDEFVSPGVKTPAIETTVTLAQGLPDAKHTLEISGGAETIAALRMYQPPLEVRP